MKKSIGIAALLCVLFQAAVVLGVTPFDGFVPGDDQTAPLEAAGKPERLSAEEFSERAGNEIDIYRKFGAAETVLASWKHPEDAARRVEVFFHAFPAELLAFGAYAEFRATGDAEEAWGNGGVAGERRAFFWHGKNLVMADGYGGEETVGGDLRRVVEAVAALMGEAPPRPAGLAAFERLVSPTSVAYVPGHLLDLPDLPPGFVGTAGETTVFAASEPVASRSLLVVLAKQVTARLAVPWDDPESLAFEDPGLGPVVLALRGVGLAGALGPPDTEGLRELLGKLVEVPESGR
jgi:hypothetical protein